MAIYPVQIPNRSTMYVEGTKGAITAKLKSLGYTKFNITNPISKTKLVTNRLGKGKIGTIKPIKVGSIPPPSARTAGLGKGASGPNNPGMKPDLEAQSKRPDVIKKKKAEEDAKKKKQQSNKRGGSGNQTKKLGGATKPVNKKTVDNKQKIQNLAKKVKARMPNVSMSKILDTIRTQIRKRPLTAVAGATGVGVAIGTILSALKSTKVADATLTGNKIKVINTKGGQKNKTKTPTKTKKPANPKVAITIATPLPKPKRDKDKNKKKTDKSGSGIMLSLIVGGKGTTAQRMKEINAEKKLEKQLGRRPSKKELVAYLKKN